MVRKQPQQEHLHRGKQHPEMKTRRKWTFVHPNSSPRHFKRLFANSSTRQIRSQWIQKGPMFHLKTDTTGKE